MDPIEEFRLRLDDLSPSDIHDHLLPLAVATWRHEVETVGHPHFNAPYGIGRLGPDGLDALTPWLRAASGETLVGCLGSLDNLIHEALRPRPGPDATFVPLSRQAELSADTRAAWDEAMARIRAHVPTQPRYRVTLRVEEVEGIWDGEFEEGSATVTGFTRTVAGMVSLTPHTVEMTRDGDVVVSRRPLRWPVADGAVAGLRELLSQSWPLGAKAPPDWVMVLESGQASTETIDWQDGAERLSSKSTRLAPGTVLEIRRARAEDEEEVRSGPQALVPAGSPLHGSPTRDIEWAGACCARIEEMLSS